MVAAAVVLKNTDTAAVMQTQTPLINNTTCIQAHVLRVFRVGVSSVSES